MVKNYIKYISGLMMALYSFAIVSCQDDTFDYFHDNTFGDEFEVSFTVDIPPLASSQLSSRASAGDIIKDFDNLHLYVYNSDGTELIIDCGMEGLDEYKYDKNGNNKHPEYPYKDIDNNNDITYTTASGETTTPRATFKLKTSPFKVGESYQIYVTANVDVPKGSYDTADELKAYTVTWNTDDTSANAQMFGMFSNSENQVEGDVITFSNSSIYNLHAWLVRCASKVTISYDTTELNDNVWIYLHNVSVRNIVKQCHLGDGNRATVDYGVIDRGDMIMYAPEGSSYANAENEFSAWPALTKGTGEYGSDHSETADALFFYENLQGTGKDKSQIDSDKEDTPDGAVSWPDGVNPDNDKYRDEKYYGTYIEVEAYYRSTAKGNEGQGKIVYRFMLGMDALKDYNVFRNHHFKLTLNFRGNANDVDWHIDYKPNNDNPIYVPHPFYISYLYGENVEIPVTIDGQLTKGTKVIAEIVENNWKPKDAPTNMYWNGMVQSGEGMQFDGPWHGFLSLRPTNSISNSRGDQVTNADVIGRENTITDKSISSNKKAYLMSYWYGGSENVPEINGVQRSKLYTSAEIDANEGMHVPMQGYREYDTTIRTGRTNDDTRDNPDSYEIMEIINNGKTKTHLYLPLYTRALFMIKTLAYSGANPYFNYQRKAVVRITCWVDKTDENNVTRSVKYTKLCDVIQVRRLINPCGIYRASGDNKSFTVNLCFRTGENATSFMPFASEGKWSAEIESGDAGFITLNGMQKVQGRTGEYVKFQVHFVPGSASKNRYAVILVKYHDYTCKHRIMVRQGYEPDAIVEGGSKWHCFNLRGGETEGDSPLEGGSQFRFGNLDYAIDASNNTTDQFGIAPGNKPFTLVGRDGKIVDEKVRWYNTGDAALGDAPNLAFQACPDLNADDVNFRKYFTNLKDVNGNVINNGKRTRIANYSDWQSVRDNSHVFYTFGICYDGNSTSTSMTANKAFNYLYSSEDKEGSGMRGCFVYNRNDGRNFFLPTGASGHGRRQSGKLGAQPGTLHYANRVVYMEVPTVSSRPQFWNIKDNLGMLYWGFPDNTSRKDVWDSSNLPYFTTWDINVSTYDFNQFSSNAYSSEKNNLKNAGLESGGKYYYSDAAFIRLVDE